MEDLKTIDTLILLDMLAKHTQDYTAMMQGDRRKEGFGKLKSTINALQFELNRRHNGEKKTA